MQNEFRGKSIEEVVQKAVQSRYSCKNDLRLCHQLQSDLKKSLNALTGYNRELGRLDARVGRLINALEDEKATASYDLATDIGALIGAVASLHPAIRAVRLRIQALNGASNLARGKSAVALVSSAIAGFVGLGVVGVSFLKPITRQQLNDVERDVRNLKDKIEREKTNAEYLIARIDYENCPISGL